MKIAILSLYSRIGGLTGDCVQANKTADALVSIGEDVLRCYLRPEDGCVYDGSAQKLGTWVEVMGDMDVVHAMVPSRFLRRVPKVRALYVCYTVFWKSWSCTKVNVWNNRRVAVSDIKDLIRIVFSKLGIRTYGFFKDYDVLLPNSEDEICCVKRFCPVKKGARFVAVPNAIDDLPSNIESLGRALETPASDYIVVPAFFAPRKNQLSLIKAMKDVSYPMVFMGDGPMLARCKSVAGENCTFLGAVAHGSDLFWRVLRHARVVCLPSNCETPGIAGLEAAAVGARPVVPYEGGTAQYYGWDAEYLDPTSMSSIRSAVLKAWDRGRLDVDSARRYQRCTWNQVARTLVAVYREILA